MTKTMKNKLVVALIVFCHLAFVLFLLPLAPYMK